MPHIRPNLSQAIPGPLSFAMPGIPQPQSASAAMALSRGLAPGFGPALGASAGMAPPLGQVAGLDPAAAAAAVRASQQALGHAGELAALFYEACANGLLHASSQSSDRGSAGLQGRAGASRSLGVLRNVSSHCEAVHAPLLQALPAAVYRRRC